MESAVYLIYQINLENLVANKLYICKEYHIQPSEIDRMVYFDYEKLLELINEDQKKQKEENEAQNNQYQQNMPSMSSYTSGFKMPTMPKISMPKI